VNAQAEAENVVVSKVRHHHNVLRRGGEPALVFNGAEQFGDSAG
jgi:hypothetical protein